MAQVILEAGFRQAFPPAPLFDSHFPGAPRVPGSCIVEACRRALTDALPQWRVHELVSARFRHFILPGEAILLQLRVTIDSPSDTLALAECRIMRQSVRCADVRFRLVCGGDG